ncbi:MAG: right-handed parallel beta-helix repeat-containing protein [Geobacteraceae bacterium]|nr:right-handed parallel beta-helix repeat-containing protein [Geobacteraceae bacterium]
MTIKRIILSALSLLLIPLYNAEAAVITSDTIWQKEVSVTEDTLVPQGVTLTIKPGTIIKISPAESTKTDPEFISPLTEITVRGRITIEGTKDEPVTFISAEAGRENEWAGIIIDGGEAAIRNCTISGAESALYLINATVAANSLTISGNRYGITSAGKRANLIIRDSSISGNDYGLVLISDIEPDLKGTSINGNRKKDFWKEDLPHSPEPPKSLASSSATTMTARVYTDEALVGDTVWRGRVRVDGNLRIPEGSRLLITPGTVVEFSRKDTNGDGIGENGILIQGAMVAKGTKENPIIFRSSELIRKMGDWDSVNLMNSDKAENLIENCIFEDAYRGLHFHYSTVKVTGSYFANSFRGVQFQESTVEISDSSFIGNKSAIQGRDSLVKFHGNRLYNNHQGVNFFRNNLLFTNNLISGSLKEGVRIREGNATVRRNMVTANRQGMMLADIFYGSISENIIANSSEAGLALRNVDNIEVSGNYFGRNGSNGLNLQDVRAEIKGNLFTFNTERGIGITSFSGVISSNNFAENGLYAIDLESPDDIAADNNWWGGNLPENVVFDRRKDPARGLVKSDSTAPSAHTFKWPLDVLSGNITLAGDILFSGQMAVPVESALTISPGTKVVLAESSGLSVRGRINSNGTAAKPVTFTSLSIKSPGAWDEIVLEQALDSTFAYTVIEYGTWGIHGHFTNLLLDHVLIRHNNGGMRFRSGPVIVRQSVFSDNGIGIRSYIGNGKIEENIITGNEIGVFVRERGSGLVLKRNNIFANSDYNIRSGDFNSEDIPATGNWWGTKDPAQTIYDGRVEEGVGKVIFDPILLEPVNLEKAGVK